MKKRIIFISILGLFLYACSPKVTAPLVPIVKADLPTKELTEARTLYENTCARCHKLHKPSSRSKESWTPILTRMQKKAKITDEQTASIYSYLTSGLE
jgi:cytochrome c5